MFDSPVLTQSVLDGCWKRAPIYDRENRFFQEDFDELKAAGYLRLAVPKELGGLGLTFAEACQHQRHLGYYSAPTALGLNMHQYWVGVAADLWRAGDRSLEWLLKDTANGAVLAAGHAESGNDVPLLYSTTKAVREEGGYRFYGRKSFGSLSPVWTYLGLHGVDASDPASPKIVHAFMPRNTEGWSIKETWDVMGMRATKSEDTILDGAFVPDKYIGRVVKAGAAGVDPFILSIFAWAPIGMANVYYGLARRALEITVESVKRKTSVAMSRPMAYHAEVQHGIAEMVLDFEAIGPQLDRVADDWVKGVDYGAGWVIKLLGTKYRATEAAWRIVDRALDLSGGFGIFNASGLERLFRDARLGRIHPGNSAVTHEFVAKVTLGLDLDERPRWG
jgi:alkylation response protein AidB-like acyl-CoA dehydrogenase